jgi:hypothetical protein
MDNNFAISIADQAISSIRDRIELCNHLNHEVRRLRTFKSLQTPRYELASRCFDLSIEHHAGLAHLISNKQYGSANALLRCSLESTIAGLWIIYCAGEDLIQRIESGTWNWAFDTMLKVLSSTTETQEIGPHLRKAFSSSSDLVKMLHDFTHGGTLQLNRRFPGLKENPGFTLGEIRSSLMISDMVIALAAAGLSVIEEQPELHATAQTASMYCIKEANIFFGGPEPPNSPLPPLQPPKNRPSNG